MTTTALLPPTHLRQRPTSQRAQTTALRVTPPRATADGVNDSTPVEPRRAEPAAGHPHRETYELYVRAQQGDTSAWDRVHQLHNVGLRRYIHRQFVGKNYAIAEDIAQDVWSKAIARIHSWSYLGTAPEAWLFTIARNLIADYYKSALCTRTFISATPTVIGPHHEMTGDQAEDDVEAYVVAADRRRALLGVLDTVAVRNPEQARVLRLRYLEERTVRETAGIMGMTEGGVKALTYRATRALARRKDIQHLRAGRDA